MTSGAAVSQTNKGLFTRTFAIIHARLPATCVFLLLGGLDLTYAYPIFFWDSSYFPSDNFLDLEKRIYGTFYPSLLFLQPSLDYNWQRP